MPSWKAPVFVLLTVAVIGVSACAPSYFFGLQDTALYASAHKRQKNENRLDFDVAQMAQVRSIHEICSPSFDSDQHQVPGADRVVLEEVEQLAEQGVFTHDYAQKVRQHGRLETGNISILFPEREDGGNLSISLYTLLYREGEDPMQLEGSFALDPFTHKIIQADVRSGSRELLQGKEANDLVRAYLSYLGLDVIEDWQYGEGFAASRSADLLVNCFVDQSDTESCWVRLSALPLY